VAGNMSSFEEKSAIHQRTAEIKTELGDYMAAHPEILQLLGGLVTSALVAQPTDLFAHAAEHFGGVAAADQVEYPTLVRAVARDLAAGMFRDALAAVSGD
jgi:hypothetical protein